MGLKLGAVQDSGTSKQGRGKPEQELRCLNANELRDASRS